MQNYCTLFNISYLSRGINLYNSLIRVSKNFRLYIFAFDSITYEYLKKINLKKVIIIPLNEFEDRKLKNIKETRTLTEYFWTCTGSTVLYLFNKYNLKSCTYLDADLYFYKNPKILIEESKESSCIISKHNYSDGYDQTKTSGIYCVQFMHFKNDYLGNKILLDWRNQCIKWCFNRFEDNKFGDQKYLDIWPKKYEGVHVLNNLGGGVAPWNVQQYKVLKKLKLQIKKTHLKFDLVFFHFHNLKFINKNTTYIGGYKIDKNIKKKIYKPYLKKMLIIHNKLKKEKNIKDINFNESYFLGGIFFIRLIKRFIFNSNFLKN
jgi:hypothetical protein